MENRLERFCLLASFILPLGVYFYTAAPGPFWEDSATFSMAAATLSIPHSPGFPLWVLIGKLFTWLIPHNPARATNLMCGLFAAGGAALFFLCTQKILSRLNESFLPEENTGTRTGAPTIALTALGAALVFAFSQTVWLQAVRAEVYSLQLVLTLSMLLMALSLDETEGPTRLFLLAAFLWGLSAAVHPLLSVSILPGFLIIGCFKSFNWKKEMSKWGWALGLILLAGTVYLFLPVRSAQNPYLNWNQPDNWERFWAAVSRSDSWQASVASTSSNFSYPNIMRLSVFLLSEYSLVIWALVISGVLALAHYLPRLGLGIFVLLLSNFLVTLWAAEFSPWNLDLLGYLSLGAGLAVFALAVGLLRAVAWLSGRLPRLSSKVGWAAPTLALLIGFLTAEKNWAGADLHQSRWPQKIAEETLRSLPPNAVVVYSSDRLLTAALYQQGALGQRPDVAIVLTIVSIQPLLAEQTRMRHPDLVIDSIPSGLSINARLRRGFFAFCQKNKRPIFTQLGHHIGDSRFFWPAGYLLQFRPKLVGPEVPKMVLDFVRKTFTGNPDILSKESLQMEIYNWGAYLSNIGAPESNDLLKLAAEYDGENPRTWVTLGKAYLFSRQFPLAETCFKLALSYDPYWGEAYFFLATALQEQGKFDEAKAARSEGGWLVPDKLKPMGQDDEKTKR
ncbi:MAG: protein O-mannosyl-transferase family [Candidatus Zixiibacteriota bacterium]